MKFYSPLFSSFCFYSRICFQKHINNAKPEYKTICRSITRCNNFERNLFPNPTYSPNMLNKHAYSCLVLCGIHKSSLQKLSWLRFFYIASSIISIWYLFALTWRFPMNFQQHMSSCQSLRQILLSLKSEYDDCFFVSYELCLFPPIAYCSYTSAPKN